MYKKGLDQIPKYYKEMRMQIMKNIGNTCLKIGKFNDAINAFEEILENSPNHTICFNLILC